MPLMTPKTVKEFVIREQSDWDMIISGIILTALGDKGQVLGLALKSINKKFKRIIFIDDQKKYLEEVEKFCKGKSNYA